MGTKICNDIPKVLVVLWKIWLYFQRVPSFISRVLKCQFLRLMVVTERKAWLIVIKDPINSGRTYQYNPWESVIGRALPTSK